MRPVLAGGVVEQIDQTPCRPAPFQPTMKAPIQLHHLAEMFLALAPLPMRPPLALPAPQSFLQHPPPQRLGVHTQLVFAEQVLGRQRRSQPLADPPAIL